MINFFNKNIPIFLYCLFFIFLICILAVSFNYKVSISNNDGFKFEPAQSTSITN
jgi:hypothetical protein